MPISKGDPDMASFGSPDLNQPSVSYSFSYKTLSIPVPVPQHVAAKLTPVSSKLSKSSTFSKQNSEASPKLLRSRNASASQSTPVSPKLIPKSPPNSFGSPSPRLSRLALSVASKISPTSKGPKPAVERARNKSTSKIESSFTRSGNTSVTRNSRSMLPQSTASVNLQKKKSKNLSSFLKPKRSANSPIRNSKSVPPKREPATTEQSFEMLFDDNFKASDTSDPSSIGCQCDKKAGLSGTKSREFTCF